MLAIHGHPLLLCPLSQGNFVIPDFAAAAGVRHVEAIFDNTAVSVDTALAMGRAMVTIMTAVTELRINRHHRLVFNEHTYVHDLPQLGPYALLVLKGSLTMPTRHGERFLQPGDFLIVTQSRESHSLALTKPDQPFMFKAMLFVKREAVSFITSTSNAL
jgi:hypothetical protein